MGLLKLNKFYIRAHHFSFPILTTFPFLMKSADVWMLFVILFADCAFWLHDAVGIRIYSIVDCICQLF
jgi:hypothetical protein